MWVDIVQGGEQEEKKGAMLKWAGSKKAAVIEGEAGGV